MEEVYADASLDSVIQKIKEDCITARMHPKVVARIWYMGLGAMQASHIFENIKPWPYGGK